MKNYRPTSLLKFFKGTRENYVLCTADKANNIKDTEQYIPIY